MAYNDLTGHDWTGSTKGSMTVSASSNYVNFDPYKALEGERLAQPYWLTNGVVAGWLKLDFGAANSKTVTMVGIQVNTIPEANRAPKDFTIQGSNNDSDWTTLKTVTGETAWGSGENRTFVIASPAAYRYYKIDITDNNGDASYTQIGELFLYETIDSPNYENFTTYTEVDEGSDVTVDSATKVSWVTLKTRQETSYLYKDKGASYFDGDFKHKFEIQFSSMGNLAQTNYWMLSNTIGDFDDIVTANEDGYAFASYDDAESLQLWIIENGTPAGDSWAEPAPQPATTYYIEITRDDNGGANNTGRLVACIRTGSHNGQLRDTLVVDCGAGEQNDFRYLYSIATRDDDGINVGLANGFTQNLDIEETTTTSTTSTSTTTSTTTQTGSTSTSTEPPIAHLVTFAISS